MFVYTASSCGVRESGMRLTAPTVPWIVSSIVRPVNTRMVVCCSSSVSVDQLWMSLDSGTFSGSQKLPVSRSQTSMSLSSGMVFQLMAVTGVPGVWWTGVWDVADELIAPAPAKGALPGPSVAGRPGARVVSVQVRVVQRP